MDTNQVLKGPNSGTEETRESTNHAVASQPSEQLHHEQRSSSPLPELLPDHLKKLLDAWYEENGPSETPPCATTHVIRRNPYQRIDGAYTAYIYKNGERMHAKRYSASIGCKTVLVVKCRGFPASIINFWRAEHGGSLGGWYVWMGGNLWEKMPSVQRIAVPEEVNAVPQASSSYDFEAFNVRRQSNLAVPL
jgi:hypothetical protein